MAEEGARALITALPNVVEDPQNIKHRSDAPYDTFEGLCHADLVYGHTGGNRDSLETYMAKLRTGTLRYHRIDHPTENIVLVGDVALVPGQMTADLTVNGITKTLNNSALAVWTKDAGEWKFVAYQPTPQDLSA